MQCHKAGTVQELMIPEKWGQSQGQLIMKSPLLHNEKDFWREEEIIPSPRVPKVLDPSSDQAHKEEVLLENARLMMQKQYKKECSKHLLSSYTPRTALMNLQILNLLIPICV